MNLYLALAIGLSLAVAGGDLFVRGLVGLSRWARVPAGIVGATVAAFATSSPELSVAANSAIAGTPQLALGDALGSNIVNIALILGITLLTATVRVPSGSTRLDIPAAALGPALMGLLLLDGTLSRADAAIMMTVFLAWLAATSSVAIRSRRNATAQVLGEKDRRRIVPFIVLGLGCLVAAGYFVVAGALGLVRALGIDAFAVGATIVALGTSLPELTVAIVARARGHREVALGTILGSNVFNTLFIVPVAALIHPIAVEWREVAIGLGFGILVAALVFPGRRSLIGRPRGLILLALYGAYLVALAENLGRP